MDEKEAKAVRELVSTYQERLAIFSGAFNLIAVGLEVVLDHGEISDQVRTSLEVMCQAARTNADQLDPNRFEKGIQDLLRDEPE